MLINTVILFLRDMLPICLLLTLLMGFLQPFFLSWKQALFMVALSLFGGISIFNFAPLISVLFDGAGMELLFSLMMTLMFLCLAMGSSIQKHILLSNQYTQKTCKYLTLSQYLLVIGVGALMMIKGTNFLIYLGGYLRSQANLESIAFGIFLAAGIGLSFCCLFYFAMQSFLTTKFHFIVHGLWAFFLAGQYSQITHILAQVDWLENKTILWDSGNIIQDSSEYGHLFKALVGYEATPSLAYLITYLASLLIYYFFYFRVMKYMSDGMYSKPENFTNAVGVHHHEP